MRACEPTENSIEPLCRALSTAGLRRKAGSRVPLHEVAEKPPNDNDLILACDHIRQPNDVKMLRDRGSLDVIGLAANVVPHIYDGEAPILEYVQESLVAEAVVVCGRGVELVAPRHEVNDIC